VGGDQGGVDGPQITVSLPAQQRAIDGPPFGCLAQLQVFFETVREALPFGELSQTALFLADQFGRKDLVIEQNRHEGDGRITGRDTTRG